MHICIRIYTYTYIAEMFQWLQIGMIGRLCVCMYVCVCVCACMYVGIHVYMNTYMYVNICICTYIYAYMLYKYHSSLHFFSCKWVCLHTIVSMHVFVHVCMHLSICICICICTYLIVDVDSKKKPTYTASQKSRPTKKKRYTCTSAQKVIYNKPYSHQRRKATYHEENST
jgi:hypothetical protein